MFERNIAILFHLDYNVDKNGVKRYIAEIVEYVDYGREGTIINPIFKRNLNIRKQTNGTYTYDVNYEYGSISKNLFDKMVNCKVMNNSIDRFVKDEYYD